MSSDRRTFLKTAALGIAAGTIPSARTSATSSTRKRRILVLGGTSFIGPPIVETALARGHEVTLFNRGRTNNHLFPDLEKIRGDRNNPDDVAKLSGRDWDLVIDNCGYFPDQVEASAKAVADRAGQYIFVSSLSVFPMTRGEHDETSPTATITDEQCETAIETRRITGQNYGPLKARCEAAAEAAMPGRATTVRPGLIVGPGDPTQRFTYWPARVARGGEVLAPGDGTSTTQFVDVRDLGDWIVDLGDHKTMGVFNAVGFDGLVTLAELLHGCKIVIGSDCTFTWVDEDFLQENGVNAFMGSNSLPLWIPGGRSHFVNERARKAGLTFRPIGDTIRDTIAWFREQPERPWNRAGMSAEAEAKVLAAWHAREKPKSAPK